jgi:hypothetical protein
LLAQMKAEGLPCKLMARRLPGRGLHAIYNRLHQLGLTSRRAWSPTEDLAILIHYGTAPVHRFMGYLPGRTLGAAHTRAWRLGLAVPHQDW